MIEIELGLEDVARTRFAISPLWEVVASVRVLKGADEHGLHRTWVEQVRPRLAAADLDLSPLFDLVPVPTRSPWAGRIPGFICPHPRRRCRHWMWSWPRSGPLRRRCCTRRPRYRLRGRRRFAPTRPPNSGD
jgi:hypothetical protein